MSDRAEIKAMLESIGCHSAALKDDLSTSFDLQLTAEREAFCRLFYRVHSRAATEAEWLKYWAEAETEVVNLDQGGEAVWDVLEQLE
jgi:hypothetical protein